jgi:hypothetical protein
MDVHFSIRELGAPHADADEPAAEWAHRRVRLNKRFALVEVDAPVAGVSSPIRGATTTGGGSSSSSLLSSSSSSSPPPAAALPSFAFDSVHTFAASQEEVYAASAQRFADAFREGEHCVLVVLGGRHADRGFTVHGLSDGRGQVSVHTAGERLGILPRFVHSVTTAASRDSDSPPSELLVRVREFFETPREGPACGDSDGGDGSTGTVDVWDLVAARRIDQLDDPAALGVRVGSLAAFLVRPLVPMCMFCSMALGLLTCRVVVSRIFDKRTGRAGARASERQPAAAAGQPLHQHDRVYSF